MQALPEELLNVLSSRLKLGDRARPNVRIEVDRLAFVPGKVETLTFLTEDYTEVESVEKIWIEDYEDGTYGGSSSLNSTDIVFPLQGYTMASPNIVSSGYGMRNGRMHKGIDLKASVGVPILACWAGKVAKVTREQYNGAGFAVNIKHAEGVITKYFHMSQILVEGGQEVAQGQLIGYSGNTGDVRSGGKAVTGSFSDPASDRAQGVGAHLHFEIWKGVDANSATGAGGYSVDPNDYLSGNTTIFLKSTNTGTVGNGLIDDGIIVGYPGEIKLNERFNNRDWFKAKGYTVDSVFNTYAKVEREGLLSTGGRAVYTFPSGLTAKESRIEIDLEKLGVNEGYLDVGYTSNFVSSQDKFTILMSDGTVERLARNIVTYNGNGKLLEVKKIAIPEGTKKVILKIKYSGMSLPFNSALVKESKKFALEHIKIQEIINSPYAQSKTEGSLDPAQKVGHFEEVKISNLVMNERKEKVDLQVGRFTYMDTLVLPNVMSFEVDEQFEGESSELRVVISNRNGFFSPDYNPYFFPEMRNLSSPWSYQINGFQVGVLSTNTPIRVFIGYGLSTVRYFTGLIDKVDSSSSDTSLVITARDMYKKISDKTLLQNKKYPDTIHDDQDDPTYWQKSAIVQDLIAEAGMFGWRGNEEDRNYPDAVIEEMYLIEILQRTGKVLKAVPDSEGEFSVENISSYPTPQGWLNPFLEVYGKEFLAYQVKVGEAVQDTLKDTNYRARCDRYGTFRLESVDYFKPVTGTFTEYENLIQIDKNSTWANGRSHVVVEDEEGRIANFVDKEILMELKGELCTAKIYVPWAKTTEAKKVVAERFFLDCKRLCRTIQVSIPADPSLEVLDNIRVSDRNTMTSSVYTIKGIRTSFSVTTGMLQVIDMMWATEGATI